MRRLLLLPVLLLGLRAASGQDLSETLSTVGEAYARGYVAPLVDAVGADLNAGLFRTARVEGRYGLTFFVGVQAFGMMLDGADQTFDLAFDDVYEIDGDLAEEVLGFRPDGASLPLRLPARLTVRDAPTLFGSATGRTLEIDIDATTNVRYLGATRTVAFDTTLTEPAIDGLVETSFAPFAVPQVGVGGVLGTDVLVRWLPRVGVADVGSVDVLGAALRHSLSQYVPQAPLDAAVQVAWQRLRVEDGEGTQVVSASTFAANLQLSKRLSILTLYGGAQVEQSTVDVNYSLEPDGLAGLEDERVEVSFEATGLNRARGIVGVGLTLGPLFLNGDVGFGRRTVVSAGLGLGF